MAYARVPEHPDYTRSGARWIPEIWSGKILEKLYAATCLSEICNTDYEGEIKNFGDTVIIRTVAPITMRRYVVGQKLISERPVSTPTSLSIDTGWYWNTILNDVMKVQSDLSLLEQFTDEAARQMKITIEQDTFQNKIATNCAAANRGVTAGALSAGYVLGVNSGTQITFDKGNVLDYIVDSGSVLDEQNVPETNRWIVIPTWLAGLIKKSDLKNASIMGDTVSVIRNGMIGELDRYKIFVSNLLYSLTDTVTCWYIPFGHPMACTWATQLTETETLRSHDDFGDEVRGLDIYGFKVVKTEAIGEMYGHK